MEAAVPNWRAGDSIYFGRRTLRVVGKRDVEATNRRWWLWRRSD
jgi:hypothetical protein